MIDKLITWGENLVAILGKIRFFTLSREYCAHRRYLGILLINKVGLYLSFNSVSYMRVVVWMCEVIKQNYQYTNDYNTNLGTSLALLR